MALIAGIPVDPLNENVEGKILIKPIALEEARNKDNLETAKLNPEEKGQSISGNNSTFFKPVKKLDSSHEEKNIPPNSMR